MLDYFYGGQADLFSFYRLPKALFVDPRLRPGRPVFLLSIAQSSLCRPQIPQYLCGVKNPVWPLIGSDGAFGQERLDG